MVSVHPGTVRTKLSDPSQGHKMVSAEEAAISIIDTLDRLPADPSGSFVVYDGTEMLW
ncbi:Hypothetical protein NGAL_HAMBI2427_54530 [Neorhizobium galegae bv. orientalis]|uniref:Short-chain dehydrogenase/reductase SDR n=2 Tax=Neorhizobium galegae TaxID=399 RepID=A0A068T1T6_NEOGA|nr:Hypothetical protein RG540_PA07740 [Neorhizobium galegae bv. orientalis str. HAMBI 540]CDZ54049.1 Hypothetical protein NGAL_HAMBI2427_54530 [Neorhizobium galegae bv. orientalis]